MTAHGPYSCGLDAAPRPALFQPFAQEMAFSGGLVIRAERDAPSLVTATTRRLTQQAIDYRDEGDHTLSWHHAPPVRPQGRHRVGPPDQAGRGGHRRRGPARRR